MFVPHIAILKEWPRLTFGLRALSLPRHANWSLRGWGFLVVVGILVLTTTLAMGQSRKELEDRRRRLIREIDETNTRLQQTRRTKEATLNGFLALQAQVKRRQQLIKTLQQEIRFSEASMVQNQFTLVALAKDVERLKQEYGQMMRIAYRHQLQQSYWLFLFSAQSLNDAFQRVHYLRQYTKHRQRQAKLLQTAQRELKQQSAQLEASIATKAQLLQAVKGQEQELTQELAEKDKVLQGLKQAEKKLLDELRSQEKDHADLNRVIEQIIRTEITANRRRARNPEVLNADVERKTPATEVVEKDNRPGNRVAPEGKEPTTAVGMANSFGRQKGRLPWPVEGVVVRRYGTFTHPKYKDVKVTNNGIDIQVQGAAVVRAVWEGQVAGVQYLPANQYIVILQHGNFYTVYSNLREVFVKKGESIRSRQDLGRADPDRPDVHFEVWRERQKENPTGWLTP